jgi:hypothetical protein
MASEGNPPTQPTKPPPRERESIAFLLAGQVRLTKSLTLNKKIAWGYRYKKEQGMHVTQHLFFCLGMLLIAIVEKCAEIEEDCDRAARLGSRGPKMENLKPGAGHHNAVTHFHQNQSAMSRNSWT